VGRGLQPCGLNPSISATDVNSGALNAKAEINGQSTKIQARNCIMMS
jgi:hypothetical protein